MSYGRQSYSIVPQIPGKNYRNSVITQEERIVHSSKREIQTPNIEYLWKKQKEGRKKQKNEGNEGKKKQPLLLLLLLIFIKAL